MQQAEREPKPAASSSDAASGTTTATPKSARGASIAPLERRLSRSLAGTLARRTSKANCSPIDRRVSNSFMLSVPEVVTEETPSSPTVLRLRALARAVRASHSLGIAKPARRKYLLQVSEFGSDDMQFGVDLLMAGIQNSAKEDPKASHTKADDKNGSSSEGSNNSEDGVPGPRPSSGNAKSKLRFKKDENAGGEAPNSVPSPNGKPSNGRPSFKGSSMKRGSTGKANVQRLSSIRGDLSAFKAPFESSMLQRRGSGAGLDMMQNLGARLTCARSLYKLSCQVGSELAIIEGGAIAQIADFSDVEDPTLLRYSAAVLANATTDPAMLADFVAYDGISALLELSWTPLLDVKVVCATALCRLSQSRAHAAALMRCRAITELLSLLTVPKAPLQTLVVSCVLNLIFHRHAFPDRVFLGDPNAVQNPLGVMNIVSQLSASPATSHFAVEALFNLSLYRASCMGALRGGGAEILHTLVSQICKVLDGNPGGSSSRYLAQLGAAPPAWATDPNLSVNLLQLAADTLANFSAFSEYHGILSSYGVKILSVMLMGALRDVGSRSFSPLGEERLRRTSVACSRALANFSSNSDLRRQAFTQELVHWATKLALLNHQHYTSSAEDARALLRNVVRTLMNLSFDSTCTAFFMEQPQVLTLLNAIIVLPPVSTDAEQTEEKQQSPQVQEEQTEGEQLIQEIEQHEQQLPSMDEGNEDAGGVGSETRGGIVGSIALGSLSVSSLPPSPWYMQSSSFGDAPAFPWSTEMSEDVKEDALITVLNLAQLGQFASELLRTLDGNSLAAAADDTRHSRRLRYIYASVLCNLLFDSHLQQLVYGDQVVRALVGGFYFFQPSSMKNDSDEDRDGAAKTTSLPSTPSETAMESEKARFQALNLAFDDDQERFLASIYLIASELMDTNNIELIVTLVLACLRVYVDLALVVLPSTAPSHPQRTQMLHLRPVTCYASASLFALARSSTQRRDSQKHLIYSEEAQNVLINVCGLPAPSNSGSSGATCSNSGSITSTRCGVTQAFCAATLYHLCASGPVNQNVIQGLIDCCNVNEETQSLLACSAAFAIISFTPAGCQQLVECRELARALNRLGRTSQVECQQYAAIAACNVSTITCVWSSAELKDFIVVALLRANSIQAKQIHAKTLSNLLSHGASRLKVVEDGVLYALMKLSQVMLSGSVSTTITPTTGSSYVASHRGSGPAAFSLSGATAGGGGSMMTQVGVSPMSSTDEVFSIGLQALFNLSCDRQYHDKLLKKGVVAYLSAAVEGKQSGTSSESASSGLRARGGGGDLAISSFLFDESRHRLNLSLDQTPQHALSTGASHLSVESRRFALAIICNLASYEENHKELMHAQVSEVIRNYVDRDIEARSSAAMALRNLSCHQPWVEMLCERKTLHLLIVFTQCDHPVVCQFAIEALANCSLVTDSLHLFGELHVPRAVLSLLETTANVSTSTTSPSSSSSVSWVSSTDQGNELGDSTDKASYMAALKCLSNVAHDDTLALALMEENTVLRLLPLLEHRALGADESACELAVGLAHTLAGKPHCADALLRQRAVSLCALLHRRHPHNCVIARESVRILMLLSTYQSIQQSLCETQAVQVIVSICGGGNKCSTLPVAVNAMSSVTSLRLRECGAVAIRNLTLSVTEHLALFYDQGDEGEGSLRDLGSSEVGAAQRPFDTLDDLDDDGNGEHSAKERATASGEPRPAPISRILERHLLHGVKHFQQEVASGQASERILLEASAAIANLSTVKCFRASMVRLGVIPTLLQLMGQPQQPGQRSGMMQSGRAPMLRLRSTCHSTLLGRICSATLHRLAAEEGAAMDSRGMLVPSLLLVLRQTDEELQQVRYECEKISLFSPNEVAVPSAGMVSTPVVSSGGRRFTRVQSHAALEQPRPHIALLRRDSAESSENGTRRGGGSSIAAAASAAKGLSSSLADRSGGQKSNTADCNGMFLLPAACAATTQCVRQTYREQKWMVYVLKTTLSSQSMIPQLEKKQMRALGLPKLCSHDLSASAVSMSASAAMAAAAAAAASIGNISSRSTSSHGDGDMFSVESDQEPVGGGYLLSSNWEKHVIRRVDGCEEIVPVSAVDGAASSSELAVRSSSAGANRLGISATTPMLVTSARGSNASPSRALGAAARDTTAMMDPLGHFRKFDRQMRLSRRNDRRDLNSLPPV